MFLLEISKHAEKAMDALPAQYQVRVGNALIKLSNNPFIGKKLDGDLRGVYSLRIWPYRIIYKIYTERLLIVVIRIGHRKNVYRFD